MAAYTTIDDPGLYFNTIIWTGTSNTANRAFTGVGFQPDAVWNTIRDDVYHNNIFDSVRGAGADKELITDTNALEGGGDASEFGYLSAFDADGFSTTAGTGTGSGIRNLEYNQSGNTFVAWCWKESATAGFDITTATGTGSAKTISHSLSAVPHVMISKEKTGSVNDWTVYHHKLTSAPETDSIILNETNATADQNTHWNDTAPTSSVFTVGTGSVVNRTDSTYVYYLFSEKQGYSKFGGYTGNGNADGEFIYLGFRPAFFLCKNYQDAGDDWILHDNKRDPHNVTDAGWAPNSSAVEFTDVDMDFLSNGVKMRNNTGRANSAKTFVYMAFAEAPFVNSNGVPCNAR